MFFLLIGLVIVGAACFAETIGLDNNPGWGKGRVAILIIGILTIAWGIFYSLHTNDISRAFDVIKLHLTDFITGFRESSQEYWYTIPAAVFVILVYVWFASSGSWTTWISATRYYADQANGFEHGQFHLSTRPSSNLLNLSNPYDPALRKGIEFPIDYSLFKGKFYIYWGPVPALLLVLLNPFTSARVGDLYLAFGFISGVFILQYILLLTLWHRIFRHLPKWLLLLSILVSGLSGPWNYMLVNEPNGRIYEAAISGAQFFLLGGLLVVIRNFGKSNWSYVSLALTGFLWGLSIGTRLAIVVPIGFVCLVLVYHLWKVHRSSFTAFGTKVMALGLPLLFCILGLGWYNWVRFGSVADTGFAYSLAHQDMMKYQNELFSPGYMIQNLYNYILNIPTPITQFPFVTSRMGREDVLPFLFSSSELYQTQPITGLLYLAPFTIFAIIPIIQIFKESWRGIADDGESSQTFNSVYGVLFGVFLVAFCFLLIFFWAALRYMGDFMPELVIAGSVGFWRGFQLLDQKPTVQKLYSITGIILAIAGIIVSILISLSADQYATIHFKILMGFPILI